MLFLRLLIGQHVLTIKGYTATPWYGEHLTSPHTARMCAWMWVRLFQKIVDVIFGKLAAKKMRKNNPNPNPRGKTPTQLFIGPKNLPLYHASILY